METRRGFTLIELLVVIAIIALLAAILFPVFAKAREKARQTTCESNEKQICLALLQYSSDYDERFPVCWSEEYRQSPAPNPPITRSWDQALTPYNGFQANFTKGFPTILVCPDDSTARPLNYTPRSYALAGATNGYFNDYDQSATDIVPDEAAQGFAGPVLSGYGGWHYQSGHQQLDILAPAETLMVVEQPGGIGGGGHPDDNGDAVTFRPGAFGGTYNPGCDTSGGACGQTTAMLTLEPHHSGGFNYGFCDGHVKWYNPRLTVAPASLKYYNAYCGSPATCNMHGLWSLDPND